jgi:dGTPase
MDAPTLRVMNELRDFMFDRVYQAPAQLAEQTRAIALIRDLVDYHLEHPGELPETYRDSAAPLHVQVADYVAGMTDRFALTTHQRLFGP